LRSADAETARVRLRVVSGICPHQKCSFLRRNLGGHITPESALTDQRSVSLFAQSVMSRTHTHIVHATGDIGGNRPHLVLLAHTHA